MDQFRRFMLEQLDIRGVVVRLGPAWRAMHEGRTYAPPVTHVLGEMTAISVALAGQMKAGGRLGFQLRGSGPIQRLFIDCNTAADAHSEILLRGMASADLHVPELSAGDLLGHGQLVMTLELPESREPFQSVVPMEGQSIGAIFEHYIAQSEQQATRLLLAADETHATALLVNKLPGADQKDPDGWNRILHLLETLQRQEMLALDPETLLGRLFAEEAVRVFTPRSVRYHCPEDWPKILSMLRSLGADELQAILDEHGEIVVKDDVCNREYRLGPSEVNAMLAARDGKSALH